jgi:hypothetical protein
MPVPKALSDLLLTSKPAELGPERRAGVRAESGLNAELDQFFAGTHFARERQELIRALLLLWHDHLESAHRLAQEVPGSDGAFVHGIMHRREPDFGNAAYWFRRAGRHPVFKELAGQVAREVGPESDQRLTSQLMPKGEWDPFAFINACEQVQSGKAGATILRKLQQLEFVALLEYLCS